MNSVNSKSKLVLQFTWGGVAFTEKSTLVAKSKSFLLKVTKHHIFVD